MFTLNCFLALFVFRLRYFIFQFVACYIYYLQTIRFIFSKISILCLKKLNLTLLCAMFIDPLVFMYKELLINSFKSVHIYSFKHAYVLDT